MVANPLASAGNVGSTLVCQEAPGEGSGNPLQYSCQYPMYRGAWGTIVHQVAKVSGVLTTRLEFSL